MHRYFMIFLDHHPTVSRTSPSFSLQILSLIICSSARPSFTRVSSPVRRISASTGILGTFLEPTLQSSPTAGCTIPGVMTWPIWISARCSVMVNPGKMIYQGRVNVGEKAGVLRYVTCDIARLHNCLEVFAAYHDHPSHQTILLHEFDGTVSRLSVSSPNIVGGPCDSYDRFLFQCPWVHSAFPGKCLPCKTLLPTTHTFDQETVHEFARGMASKLKAGLRATVGELVASG